MVRSFAILFIHLMIQSVNIYTLIVRRKDVFKMANPGPFLFNFSLFNQTLQFYNKLM